MSKGMIRPESKTIIGVDPSMRHTGVCIIAGPMIVATLCVEPPKKLTGVLVLQYIADAFEELLEDHTPNAWAIEGYSYGSVGRKAQLAEVGGVIKLLLANTGTEGIIIAPTRVKKYTGDGRASKEDIRQYIMQEEGIDTHSYDIADAMVIGRIAQAVLSYRATGALPNNRKQAEVIVAEAEKNS